MRTWLLLFTIAAAAVSATILPQTTTSVAETYSSKGCYVETNPPIPALNGPVQALTNLTASTCHAACSNFQLFALRANGSCDCGDSIDTSAVRMASDDDCTTPCSVTDAATSGNFGNKVQIYRNLKYIPPIPFSGTWFPYIGCYNGTNSSGFGQQRFTSSDMTATTCVNLCLGSGMYSSFATQDGTTCLCSSHLPTGPKLSEANCNTPCGGNMTELCGGPSAFTVYGKPQSLAVVGSTPYYYQGCFPDNSSRRILSSLSVITNDMGLEKCQETCAQYPNFGVEFGRECYCGFDESWRGSAVSNDHCTTPCAGNSGLSCGGYGYISVYASPEVREQNPACIRGYNQLSCWMNDLATPSLTGGYMEKDDMTLDVCRDACDGYEYFGVQNGRVCLCGNSLVGGVALETQCNVHCAGNHGQWCGGNHNMNVYKKATLPP